MGHQRNYSWEFKLQMVQLLEKGEQNPSQISQDHHVTRSLLYVWWQLYRERGEAVCVPTQSFPASIRGGSTAHCARTDCPSRATVWATDPRTRSAAIRGRCVKKSLASAPIQQRYALIERVREQMPACSVRKLCRLLQIHR